MATKKSGGSTRNGRDSCGKSLGIKMFGGSFVRSGQILIRQRGTNVLPLFNVGTGVDHTLYALKDGFVYFSKNHLKRTFVSVV